MPKRRAPARPDRQLELASAVAEPGAVAFSADRGRPPVILELGPRDFSVLVWARDENETLVYRVRRIGLRPRRRPLSSGAEAAGGGTTMNGRAFISAVVIIGAAFAGPPPVASQQAEKIFRVGILDGGSSYPERQALWSAFKQALSETGYIEGRNIAFEVRWGAGRVDTLPELAGELVRASVDVIAIGGTPAALAAKRVTASIPIVLVLAGDPVRTGLAASLGRPGGNVTGLTTLTTELSAKRLELLRQMLPTMRQLGVVWDNNPAFTLAVQDTEASARAMNISMRAMVVRGRDELETVFADLASQRVAAVEIMPNPFALRERRHVAKLALKYRMPTVFAQREYVEAGGLMSYGSNLGQMFRRAAIYVAKILRGARPADLPIERPTAFELVINLKTAKTLGLTSPPALLQRADQVIE